MVNVKEPGEALLQIPTFPLVMVLKRLCVPVGAPSILVDDPFTVVTFVLEPKLRVPNILVVPLAAVPILTVDAPPDAVAIFIIPVVSTVPILIVPVVVVFPRLRLLETSYELLKALILILPAPALPILTIAPDDPDVVPMLIVALLFVPLAKLTIEPVDKFVKISVSYTHLTLPTKA